jgi:hypothetical protein
MVTDADPVSVVPTSGIPPGVKGLVPEFELRGFIR